jgi:hypothetical protein
MSLRAEIRRELERGNVSIDRCIEHLKKAGTMCIQGGRPEIDEGLKAVAVLLTATQNNVDALHDRI